MEAFFWTAVIHVLVSLLYPFICPSAQLNYTGSIILGSFEPSMCCLVSVFVDTAREPGNVCIKLDGHTVQVHHWFLEQHAQCSSVHLKTRSLISLKEGFKKKKKK